MITHAAASAAILAHCDAGTIVQDKWHGRRVDGRAVACLLGAIDPSVEKPADCNAELMPMWLAELTPVLFDGLPADAIYTIARRYGSLVARWHQLSDAQWNAILNTFLCHVIDRAVNSTRRAYENRIYWPKVVAACKQSKAAIESGDKAATEVAAAKNAIWVVDAVLWTVYAATVYEQLFVFLLDEIEQALP